MGSCCEAGDSDTIKIIARHKWKSNKKSSIVIIGCGPAGVHMATLLAKSGFSNITILEKGNRIGGKSWTITDKSGSPQEMGTCFTSKLADKYGTVFALFDEYFPENAIIDLPDSEKAIINIKTGVIHDFQPYLMAETEEISTPEWMHFLPDILTGGLSLLAAIQCYIKLHTEIFGEDTEYPFNILPRPKTDAQLAAISMTMAEFLEQHKLQAMIPLYLLSYSMFGYGSIHTIPAYYGLWFFTPSMLKAIISLTELNEKKSMFEITSLGYQQLWINMIDKYHSQIKVIFNCDVSKIQRRNNSNRKGSKIKITYNAVNETEMIYDDSDAKYEIRENEEQKSISITSDVLFLACGNSNALPFLDASEEEIKIFSKVKHFILSTTLVDFDRISTVENKYRADNLYPEGLMAVNGQTIEFRMTQKLLKLDGYPNDIYGQENKDRAIVKQFIGVPSEYDYDIEDPDSAALVLLEWRESSYRKIGIDVARVQQRQNKNWQYFPHFSIEDIRNGYPWIIRDQMQGKYYNTYYIGSSVCFESVKDVVEYNIELQKQIHF